MIKKTKDKKILDILEKIKKEITPDIEIIKNIDSFVDKLNSYFKSKNLKIKCIKGGSIAKGTFLKDDFDVDLFIKFDYSYKNENISSILEKSLLEQKIKYEKIHGSRDYFIVKFSIKDKNLTFEENHFSKKILCYELVPVLDIKNPEKAINVTDMSPLHVSWVKKNLKKGQEDEIRLAKKFCKGINVYGAESYINGFSGHVIDILIIYYGSFLKLLKESIKWKPKVIIDPEKHFKSKDDVLFNLNKAKTTGPLIIVDPILKYRNAAASLSYEKFNLFIEKAKEFLENPSEDYFKEKSIQEIINEKIKEQNKITIVEMKIIDQDLKKERYKEILYAKILKTHNYLKDELIKKGFKIVDSNWGTSVNQKELIITLFYISENLELKSEKLIKGPMLNMKEHVERFKNKYIKTYVKDDCIYAIAKINKVKITDNIKEIFNKSYYKKYFIITGIKTI
ncbi:MAG: nucleotidyltransferase domain-containing protein [Candidatus Woesearchaeota archaeon]